MTARNLPPLEVATTYVAADFEQFDFLAAALSGRGPTLRVHLRNRTIIEIPATDEALRYLRNVLNAAYPT